MALFRVEMALLRDGVALFRVEVALLRDGVALFRVEVALLRDRVALLRVEVALLRDEGGGSFQGGGGSIQLWGGSLIQGGGCHAHITGMGVWTYLIRMTQYGIYLYMWCVCVWLYVQVWSMALLRDGVAHIPGVRHVALTKG